MGDASYVAASGGMFNTKRLDIVSNNLANVSTVGFKAQRLVGRQQEFSDTLLEKLPGVTEADKLNFERTPGVVDLQTQTDFSPGPIEFTGNPLHVALRNPNQFFIVQTPNGPAYTKAGNFTLNAEGGLVTADGLPVSGSGGPISLPNGPIQIKGNGEIVVNGETVEALGVVEIDDLTQLSRSDGARFTVNGGGQPRQVPADVVPGSVELPNVSVVEAMIDMINASKGFELYTKTARTVDELNEYALRTASRA